MGTDFRYVLVARHAPHENHVLIPVKSWDETRWQYPTVGVARRLFESVTVGAGHPQVKEIISADTEESLATARLLAAVLAGDEVGDLDGPRGDCAALLPRPGEVVDPTFNPDQVDNFRSVADGVRSKVSHLETSGAVLIVGHLPQLSLVAGELTRPRWRWSRSRAIPMASSEVLCLRFPANNSGGLGRGRLTWTNTPGDDWALTAILDKVRNKMDSARQLSTVITLLLSATLGVLLDQGRWSGLAAARAALGVFSYDARLGLRISFLLLILALGFFLATMYSYDRLLMPATFWAEGRPKASWRAWAAKVPQRPPSSAATVVHRNMILVWDRLFVVANVLVVLAIAVAGLPLLRVSGWQAFVAALVALAAGGWIWWVQPVIGSHD